MGEATTIFYGITPCWVYCKNYPFLSTYLSIFHLKILTEKVPQKGNLTVRIKPEHKLYYNYKNETYEEPDYIGDKTSDIKESELYLRNDKLGKKLYFELKIKGEKAGKKSSCFLELW